MLFVRKRNSLDVELSEEGIIGSWSSVLMRNLTLLIKLNQNLYCTNIFGDISKYEVFLNKLKQECATYNVNLPINFYEARPKNTVV